MLKTAISLSALVLLGVFAAPAIAATDEAGFSPDGAERTCVFIAEVGGHQCESFDAGGSLSGLGDGNAKKKITIIFPTKTPNIVFPKL